MTRSAMTIVAAIILGGIVFAAPARALSVQDFDKLPDQEQAHFVTNFIEKMTADIWTANPTLAQEIRDWFSRKQPDKPWSEGSERVWIELGAVDMRAKDGRADPSKIKVESIIVWVVKQKFPPPGA